MFAGTAPAVADWLVLTTGERVETRGPWRVEARRVTFTNTRGALTSVRLEVVDLDASAAANAEKRVETTSDGASAGEPTPATPVLVLTQSDIPSIYATTDEDEPGAAEAGAADGGRAPTDAAGATEPAAPAAAAEDLQVLDWSADPADGDLVVTGSIRNRSDSDVDSITLLVTLVDADGQPIETREARLGTRGLSAGARTFFEVTFPDHAEPSRVQFLVSSSDDAGGGPGS